MNEKETAVLGKYAFWQQVNYDSKTSQINYPYCASCGGCGGGGCSGCSPEPEPSGCMDCY